MYKKLLKLLDRNHNNKLDWHEILFPTPDINNNKRVDWWEALIGIVVILIFYGLIIGSTILLNLLLNKIGF
jgi:hypothetical protein